MKHVLLVFLGGGAGSALRFLISKFLNPVFAVPVGTFVVNISGSLLIGFILGLGLRQDVLSPNATLLLATGFCGGYTTFSAFSFENLGLLKAGEYLHFGFYTAGSIFLGIAAVMVGLYFSKLLAGFL